MQVQPAYAFGPFALERAGRVVSKAELIADLWPDGEVTEQNLAQQVFLLRSALSGHAPAAAFVVTVPGRGYRFVAPVDVRPARDVPHTDLQRLYLRGRYHWEKRTRQGLSE